MFGRKGFWGGFLTGGLLGFILGMVFQPPEKDSVEGKIDKGSREPRRAKGIVRYHKP